MRGRRRFPGAFRALLFLLPRNLRSEHEAELRQFLEAEMPDRRRDRVRYWVETLVDILRAAPGAHLDILRQDLTLAFRQLRRAPGYAALATLTLGIGIGGNVALFKVAYETLFAEPPFIDSRSLVRVDEENRELGLQAFGVSPANFRDFAAAAADLTDAAAIWQRQSGTTTIGGTPERITFIRVSGDFFRVFRETPILGRGLLPEDDVPESNAVVVSHDFWTGRLGADPGVIDRTIEIDERAHRIVGVMPAGFEYPGTGMALWRPLGLTASEWERRGARFVGSVFRLRQGVAPAALEDRLATRAAALGEALPETNEGWTTSVMTLRDAASAGLRGPILLVWLGAGLILLIAIANVANLILGRAVARQEEMDLRRALGARTGRLFRQTLTEGALLSSIGAGLGLGLAALCLQRFQAAGVGIAPRRADLALDGLSIAFTVLLVLVVTSLFSVVPALAGRRRSGAAHGGRHARGVDRIRLQSGLVVAEIAFAVVVAVSTGLLARSAARLLAEPLGYRPEAVTTFRIEPPVRIPEGLELPELITALQADRARIQSTYAAFLDRLAAEPGVESVGGVNRLPLTGNWWVTGVRLPDSGAPDEAHAAFIRVVLPGFLATMGTRVVDGRMLGDGDVAGAQRAVVIDQSFADRHWPGRSAVGQTLSFEGPPELGDLSARVVGVVETIRQANLEADPRPTMYVPLAQATEGHGSNWGMDIVLRTSGAPIAEKRLRDISKDFLPAAAVFRVQSMEDLVAASVAARRFQLLLFGGFAVTALVLTLVGVFGVLALFARERSREFGVRLALGASPRQIQWIVQRNALRCALRGSGLGLVGAFVVASAFESVVYGISAYDPLAFVIGPLALCFAALGGGFAPAWSATRTDPAEVLRSD